MPLHTSLPATFPMKARAKLHAIPQGFILSATTDAQGRILDCDQGFLDMNGFDKSEILGLPIKAIRHPETPGSTFEDMWVALRRGRSWRGTIKNQRKDGGAYWATLDISPVCTLDQIHGYVAFYCDPASDKQPSDYTIES